MKDELFFYEDRIPSTAERLKVFKAGGVVVNLDTNWADPKGKARGETTPGIVVPDGASDAQWEAAQKYAEGLSKFYKEHLGRDVLPWVMYRSDNGRGRPGTMHTEPFAVTDPKARAFFDSDKGRALHADLIKKTLGTIPGVRFSVPHNESRGDRGAGHGGHDEVSLARNLIQTMRDPNAVPETDLRPEDPERPNFNFGSAPDVNIPPGVNNPDRPLTIQEKAERDFPPHIDPIYGRPQKEPSVTDGIPEGITLGDTPSNLAPPPIQTLSSATILPPVSITDTPIDTTPQPPAAPPPESDALSFGSAIPMEPGLDTSDVLGAAPQIFPQNQVATDNRLVRPDSAIGRMMGVQPLTEEEQAQRRLEQSDQATLALAKEMLDKETALPMPEPINFKSLWKEQEAVLRETPDKLEAIRNTDWSWIELFKADFVTGNSLVNDAQEMVEWFTNDVRRRVDPNFFVTPEELKKYPENYHPFLLSANNADDYAFRAAEVTSILTAHQMQQKAWESDPWLRAIPYTLSTGMNIAALVGTGMGVEAVGMAGLKTTQQFLPWAIRALAVETATFTPLAVASYKKGGTTESLLIDLAAGGGLAMLGAGLLRRSRILHEKEVTRLAEEARFAMEVERIQIQLRREMADYKAWGQQSWKAAQEMEVMETDPMALWREQSRIASSYTDDLPYGVYRPVIDEQMSIEVWRRPDAPRDAVARYEDDAKLFESWTELAYNNNRISREMDAKINDAFERQKHVAQTNKSGYIRIPGNMTADEYLAQLQRQGRVVVLRRNARDVLGNKGGRVMKVTVPQGQELLDLGHFAGRTRGDFAARLDNLSPKIRRAKGVEKAEGPVPVSRRKLKDAQGRTVTHNGKPVEFDQADVERVGEKVKGAVATWTRVIADGKKYGGEILEAMNDAKRTLGANADQRGPFHDIPDFWFENTLIDGKPVSGGSAAAISGQTPLVRSRLVDPDEIAEDFRQNIDKFSWRKTPFSLGQKSLFRPFTPSGSRARSDQNPLWASMSEGIMDPGYNATRKELDEGRGSKMTVDRLALGYIASRDGQLQIAREKYYNLFAKHKRDEANPKGIKGYMEGAIPNAWRDSWIKEFEEKVWEFQQAKYMKPDELPPKPPPGIAEYANTLDEISADVLKHALDPGLLVGRPGQFDALEGFQGLKEASDAGGVAGWGTRVWVGDYIRYAEEQSGNPRLLEKWFKKAFEDHLLKDKAFMDWALKRAGWGKQAQEAAAQDQRRLMKGQKRTPAKTEKDFWPKAKEIADEKITQIAEGMASTIKRAKAGADSIEDIFGVGAKNFAMILRKALKERGHDLDDDLVELFNRAILKNGKVDPDKKLVDTSGKSGKHSFRRAVFDETATIKENGQVYGLKNFVSTDASQNMRGYIRRMGGRIAWGTFEWTSPSGSMTIKGINSDEAFDKFIKKPILDYEVEINRTPSAFAQDYMKTELDALWQFTTGQTPVGHAALNMFQNYSYQAYLGNAGVAQSQEISNMIGMISMRGLMTTDVWKGIGFALKEAVGAGDRAQLDAVAHLLEGWGIGVDMPRGALGSAMDERMGALAGDNLKSNSMKSAAAFLERGARLVALSSGLAPLQQGMQLGMSRGLLNDLLTNSHKGWEKMSRSQKQEYVSMFGSPEMAERVFDNIKKIGEFEETKAGGLRLLKYDEGHPELDHEAHAWMREGIRRVTDQGIQTNSYGTSHRWFNYPAVRALMTLKSFLYGSYTKQLVRNMRDVAGLSEQLKNDLLTQNGHAIDTAQAMLKPGIQIIGSMATGALGFMVLAHLKMLGMNEDERAEYYEKELTLENLAKAGVIRSGVVGILPTIWNTPMQYAGLDFAMEGYRGSGLDSTLTSLPGLNVVKNSMKLGRDIGLLGAYYANESGIVAIDEPPEGYMSMEQVSRMQRLLTNQFMLMAITSFASKQIFELETK